LPAARTVAFPRDTRLDGVAEFETKRTWNMNLVFFDHWWWLILPGLVLGLYAQVRLTAAYQHYTRVPSESGLSGADAAREILDRAGLENVPVAEVGGHLTDHYDPTKRALFLSSENYRGRSLAAVGVAAHEAGHALQHQAAYAPMTIRQALAPAASIATNAAMWISFIGWIAGAPFLKTIIGIAIGVFAVIAVFQLVTLPVEYDASRRAKEQLVRHGLISGRERDAVSHVLNAAALTYVAAMVSSLFTLLRLILIARGSSRD
jgi:Zn-dependent membrane protease YugP